MTSYVQFTIHDLRVFRAALQDLVRKYDVYDYDDIVAKIDALLVDERADNHKCPLCGAEGVFQS